VVFSQKDILEDSFVPIELLSLLKQAMIVVRVNKMELDEQQQAKPRLHISLGTDKGLICEFGVVPQILLVTHSTTLWVSNLYGNYFS
jgi:hypothetical protein